MPNDVYRAAVDGLSALVPPRAARRLVDNSLRATRRTSDDVSVSAMRQLLLGPIRHELEGVIPPSAVGPGLKRIAEGLHGASARNRRWWSRGSRKANDRDVELAEQEPGPDERDTGGDVEPAPALSAASKSAATSGPAPSVRSSLVRRVPQAERAAIEAELAERSRDTAAPAAVSPVQEADTGPAGGAPATVRREPVAPAAPLPVLDDALVVRALKAFGALETVEQIVAVRGGELMSSSGEGIDPTQLPGLALATSRLLGKNGALRVFALERAAGAVFLFPLTGGGLVVLTKPKVNVGAVLAARATLEEAA